MDGDDDDDDDDDDDKAYLEFKDGRINGDGPVTLVDLDDGGEDLFTDRHISRCIVDGSLWNSRDSMSGLSQ